MTHIRGVGLQLELTIVWTEAAVVDHHVPVPEAMKWDRTIEVVGMGRRAG